MSAPTPQLNVPVAAHNAMKQVVDMYGQLLATQDQTFALERAQWQAKVAELEQKLAAAKAPKIVPLPEPVPER